MNIRSVVITAALATSMFGVAHAQTASTGGGQSAQMPPPLELPEACRSAAQGQMAGMSGMSGSSGGMMQNMQGMGNMDEAQHGYMQAMMRMNPAMMQGMMAKDPDVAFACSMIAHHTGAIEMAKVELKAGDNSELKRMAEKTIKEQQEEVAQFTKWVEKNAKK
ncbi:DUF305 domain-containing protein [Enterovirga aerilata]|uniref:DUF305 domain-containing protein n=1 Tax=Enterovirga aerilata TaxID=2730920 RepID=A0A849IBW1_9HYPH|nr:DUF305 domain-containing protein [Enterovirga sp. DB1703]NNM73909.1 DUF305 domain-containing protein [Enterovirga sp. DB1703]